MRRIFTVWALLSVLVCASQAQNTGSSDSETIKELMQEIKELKARVAVLEARQGQPAPEQSVVTPPEPVQEPLPAEGQTLSPERVSGIFPGIRMAGFGALSYKANDARPPEA